MIRSFLINFNQRQINTGLTPELKLKQGIYPGGSQDQVTKNVTIKYRYEGMTLPGSTSQL